MRHGRRGHFRSSIAGGLLAAGAVCAGSILPGTPGLAGEFRTPSISIVRPDWQAAIDQFRREAGPASSDDFTFKGGRRSPALRFAVPPALRQLNALTSAFFPGIGRSPVPVLLPFDSARYRSDERNALPASTPDISLPRYQSGFRPAAFFEAGGAGYDAMFALDPGAGDNMPRRVYARPVEVHITGSLLTYEIDDPRGGKGAPVKDLMSDYPDLRRMIREGYVRYAFTRFGVPYVVSIRCLDSAPRRKRLACREAYPVAERFLKALRIAGGMPAAPRPAIASSVVERPERASPDFTYRPPGDIIPGSGYRNQSGHADNTVYAQIRFPLERAPAFANSQSFMNWGDCYHTGRSGWRPVKGKAYRCKRNDKPLVFDESAAENYSYPWRDNFCETRDFEAGQCSNGYGHQGQDIRPSSCALRNDGADRCLPNLHGVVAVRDGTIIRTPSKEATFLLVNGRTEHLRFRYMHMNPKLLDADGIVHGRRVFEGERIGLVSNFQDYPGGTTSHLHFDVQVFTRDGWLWVNPYVTLIASYERLIDGHGREIELPLPAPPATPPAIADAAARQPAD